MKRYVITNPPAELRIRNTDYVSFHLLLKKIRILQVYVLEQFDPGLEYEPGKRQF